MSDNKIKVCAYVRVSTGSKDQKNSFENQKSYFERELANDKYDFVGMYADEGITGTSLKKRDGFNQMIKDAGIDVDNHRGEYVYIITDREPKFNLIFVKNTSRLARNILVWDVIQKLKQKGVYIYFLDMNKSTKDMENEVILKIISVLDESESRDKSIKVKFGMEESARQGKLFTNGKLYGYNYIKEENRLEINEEEAEVVRTIFNMYSQGEGTRRIENYLRDNKMFHHRTGKEFNKATILNILKNPKYAGVNASLIWDSGSVFNTKYATLKPQDEWFSNKKDHDKIPPIISEELFKKCEDIRNNKINTELKRGVHRGKNELTGLIKCQQCRSNYTFNSAKGVTFLNCSIKKTKGIKHCNNVNISLEMLEKEIEYLCDGGYKKGCESISELYIKIFKDNKKDLLDRIDKDTKSEVDALMEELYKTQQGLDRVLDLYANLEIDKDVYLKKSEELKSKIEDLKNQINFKNRSNEDIMNDVRDIDKSIEQLKSLQVKDKYTREEMLNEISHIYIRKKIDEEDKPELMFVFKWIKTYDTIVSKYVEKSN